MLKKINKKILGSYFITTLSISLLLFLTSIIITFYLGAYEISKYVKENISFSIFLKPTAKESEILKLQKQLDTLPYVKATRFISKETAAIELKHELGESFLELINENPLPSSIEVKYKYEYANKDSIQKIDIFLKSNPIVEDIFYQKDMVFLLYENLNKIFFIIFVFVLSILLITIALLNNTIRLVIHSKRFLIKTMMLVGATKGYIIGPFIKSILLISFLGFIFSSIAYKTFIFILQSYVKQITFFITTKNQIITLIIVFIIAITFSTISVILSVNKYLNKDYYELHQE